jgi:hypothetical protein
MRMPMHPYSSFPYMYCSKIAHASSFPSLFLKISRVRSRASAWIEDQNYSVLSLDDLFTSSCQNFVELVISNNQFCSKDKPSMPLRHPRTIILQQHDTSTRKCSQRDLSLVFAWESFLDSNLRHRIDRFQRNACHRCARSERTWIESPRLCSPVWI